jgi:hypothetical protein
VCLFLSFFSVLWPSVLELLFSLLFSVVSKLLSIVLSGAYAWGLCPPAVIRCVNLCIRRPKICKVCDRPSSANRWAATSADGRPYGLCCHACRTVHEYAFSSLNHERFVQVVNKSFTDHWQFRVWRRDVHRRVAGGVKRATYTACGPVTRRS